MKSTHLYRAEYKKKAARERRMPIEADLYKKGYSQIDITNEVKERLGLDVLSKSTVRADIQYMLKEWQKERIKDTDQQVQLELIRIDEITKEAWSAWEKSKTDQTLHKTKRKGLPKVTDGKPDNSAMTVLEIMQQAQQNINYGDPRYLDVINKQNQERRKLLGLYAPEKRELSGGLTFGELLMQTSVSKDDKKEAEEEADEEDK